MKILKQPIKVIDNFFEAPDVWRHYALKQEFTKDSTSTWPGTRTASLDVLSMPLFNAFASNLIKHIHDRTFFSLLKVNFALVDETYNIGWMHQDEPTYNVAGVVFLNKIVPPNSGLSIYTKIANSSIDFNSIFFEELAADPSTRAQFIKFKLEQRSYFKCNTTVNNFFNRCVLFSPDNFHAADGYFGSTKEDSRLAITFFGVAV
jgi:hypothetical protein